MPRFENSFGPDSITLEIAAGIADKDDTKLVATAADSPYLMAACLKASTKGAYFFKYDFSIKPKLNSRNGGRSITLIILLSYLISPAFP